MTDTYVEPRDQSRVPDLPPGAPGTEPPSPPPGAPAAPSRTDRAVAGIESSMDAQRGIFASQQSALAPRYAALSRTLSAPVPQAPQQQPVAQAPQPQEFQKYSLAFAGAMAVLGAVASRYTRMSGQAALASFNGAMQGWQAGNLQAYDQAARQWEQNTRATIENNNQELARYRQVLENRRLNIDQQMQQIQLIAAQHHDAMTFEAAQSRNYTMVAQIYGAREQAAATAQRAAATLTEQRERQQRQLETTATYWLSPAGVARRSIPEGQPGALTPQQQAGIDNLVSHSRQLNQTTDSGLTDRARDDAAERYLQTGTFPPNINRGQAGSSERTAIMNRAGELAEQRGIPATQMPQSWQQNRARQVAIQRFGSGPQGNMIRSFDVLVHHLGTLDELGRALQNNDIQAVNRIANAWATQTGRAAPTNFNLAKEIVGDEIIKAVVGTGALADREAIKRQLAAANSPEQLQQAINRVVRPLVLGQITGLRRQYERTTGATDFDSAVLSPEVRRFFGTGATTTPPPGGGTGGGPAPVRPRTPEEAEALEPGTPYITPDGRVMTR